MLECEGVLGCGLVFECGGVLGYGRVLGCEGVRGVKLCWVKSVRL